jgi:SMODS-associating 2TM, beta-strand rich effector domain
MTVGRFSPYATDSPERMRVAFYIAVAAVALGYAFHWGLDYFSIAVPWFIDVPSPFVVYAILWGCFNGFLWRVKIIRWLSGVRVPDLSGKYEGDVTSSHDRGQGESHACTFFIRQSWTTILIRGEFETSRSCSQIAGFSVLDVDMPRLTYEYENTPKEGAPKTMHAHPGTVWFDVLCDGGRVELNGEYYTGQGRGNSGTIRLVRVAG